MLLNELYSEVLPSLYSCPIPYHTTEWHEYNKQKNKCAKCMRRNKEPKKISNKILPEAWKVILKEYRATVYFNTSRQKTTNP